MKKYIPFLIIFSLLISVNILFAQEYQKPKIYSALSVDSNKIVLDIVTTKYKGSGWPSGSYKYNYDHSSNSFVPTYKYDGTESMTSSRITDIQFLYGQNPSSKTGFMHNNIKPYLLAYDAPVKDFKIAKNATRNRYISTTIAAVSFTFVCVSGINALKGKNNYENTNELVLNYIAPAVLFTGSYYISGLFRKREAKYLGKAVDLYNEELINEFNLRFNQDKKKYHENEDYPLNEKKLPNEKIPADEVKGKLKQN